MEITIQKWGNSAAVRLPAELLNRSKLKLGDKLEADVHPDGVLLKQKRPSYKLADLIAQCDLRGPESDGMQAWEQANPVGREAW